MKLPANTYADPAFNVGRNTARAIVLQGNTLLLMERWRSGEHYFSIPGGGIETGETPEETVVREILEETNLVVVVDRLIYTWVEGSHTHYFFLCTYVSGEVSLPSNSEEAGMGSDNKYKPRWIALNDLNTLPFGYWTPVAEQLLADLDTGIPKVSKRIGA